MILDKLTKNQSFSFIFLVLLAGMPLMPNGILSVAIIMYALFCLVDYFKKPMLSFTYDEKRYFFSQIIFYVFLISSIFYSEDKKTAIRTIQHSIPIIIFPFLSLLSKVLTKSQLKTISIMFISSSFILSSYVIISLFYTYGISKVFNTSIVFHMVREGFFYLDVHPIYTSIYFIFSLVLILNYLFNNFSVKKLLLFSPIIIIFVLAIAILASKIIMLLLIISIIYLLIINKNLSLYSKLKIIGIILIAALVIVFNVKTINSRFTDLANTMLNNDINNIKNNSTYIRWQIYSCGLDIVSKNLFFGVGIGDVQQYLNDCYEFKNLKIGNLKSAHNFYLRVFLSCGFSGFLMFLYSLYINVKLSFSDKTKVYFFLYLSFTILMLVEDYLFRAYGVTLYMITNHIFYIFNKKRNETTNVRNG